MAAWRICSAGRGRAEGATTAERVTGSVHHLDAVVGGTAQIDEDFNGVPESGSSVLARVDANGTLDASFGNQGSARVQLDEAGVISVTYGAQGVIALPDGRLVVGGVQSPNFGGRGVIAIVWQ